jgi:hypothetical protein
MRKLLIAYASELSRHPEPERVHEIIANMTFHMV